MSSCHHPTLEDLPENVMFNILSRLPYKTIIHCKCVCKTWQNLVKDPYFANLHLSRSREGLMIHRSSHIKPGFLNFVEMKDEINHQHLLHVILPYNTIACMVGSVNGLICLWQHRGDTTCICNPIIGHYIILPKPQFTVENYAQVVHFGFGVSMAGDYKVIRIFQRVGITNPVEIEVYTIGADHEWRNIGQGPDYVRTRGCLIGGLYLDGYVHWMYEDIIYAFDLDKETFVSFASPPQQQIEDLPILGILKGCISVLSRSSFGSTVWVMKEHGNKKSWHKKLEIGDNSIGCLDPRFWRPLCLIDGLNDTSILIVVDERKCIVAGYCLGTNRVVETEIHGNLFQVMNYCPSFLKL